MRSVKKKKRPIRLTKRLLDGLTFSFTNVDVGEVYNFGQKHASNGSINKPPHTSENKTRSVLNICLEKAVELPRGAVSQQ